MECVGRNGLVLWAQGDGAGAGGGQSWDLNGGDSGHPSCPQARWEDRRSCRAL